jgi:hypothetical protein
MSFDENVRVWPGGCWSVAARPNAAASLLEYAPWPYFTFVEHLLTESRSSALLSQQGIQSPDNQ